MLHKKPLQNLVASNSIHCIQCMILSRLGSSSGLWQLGDLHRALCCSCGWLVISCGEWPHSHVGQWAGWLRGLHPPALTQAHLHGVPSTRSGGKPPRTYKISAVSQYRIDRKRRNLSGTLDEETKSLWPDMTSLGALTIPRDKGGRLVPTAHLQHPHGRRRLSVPAFLVHWVLLLH